MLEVTVNVNREQILAQVHAVRIKPKTKRVKDGTICTYKIMFNNEQVDTMEGAYGCSLSLAIKLLEHFREKEVEYKTIALYKKIGEMNDKEKMF